MKKEKIRQVSGWRLTALILITLGLVGAATLFGFYFVCRAEAHLTLRQGKNVWMALRMVAIEYYGADEDMYDYRTQSGLKREAENRVREITGCEGEIMVLENGGEEMTPTRMIYREKEYMVYFYLDADNNRQWEVYRLSSMFNLNGAEAEKFI